MAEPNLWKTKFEVFGIVQGVYFRKHTQNKANELKIRGFVRNTPQGSVEGIIEGEEMNYKKMKIWLSQVGSPKSVIKEVVWDGEKKIAQHSYRDFSIRKN